MFVYYYRKGNIHWNAREQGGGGLLLLLGGRGSLFDVGLDLSLGLFRRLLALAPVPHALQEAVHGLGDRGFQVAGVESARSKVCSQLLEGGVGFVAAVFLFSVDCERQAHEEHTRVREGDGRAVLNVARL